MRDLRACGKWAGIGLLIPLALSAATTTIAQVRQVVGVGELDPEVVVTPGIFTQRVVHIPGGAT